MKRLAQIVSLCALGSTVAGPLLFFYDRFDLGQVQFCLLLSALVWFLTAAFWMEHKA